MSQCEQIGNLNAIEITASGADESAMMANVVSQISQFSGTRAFSITWTNNNVGFLLYNYDKRRVLLDTGNAVFSGVVSSNRTSVTLNELALRGSFTTATITGTTSASGNYVTDLTDSVSIYSVRGTGGCVLTPFFNGTNWCIHASNWDGTAYASQSITATVKMINSNIG